jgi:hypothetical protein
VRNQQVRAVLPEPPGHRDGGLNVPTLARGFHGVS